LLAPFWLEGWKSNGPEFVNIAISNMQMFVCGEIRLVSLFSRTVNFFLLKFRHLVKTTPSRLDQNYLVNLCVGGVLHEISFSAQRREGRSSSRECDLRWTQKFAW
jgi:hypothetical protein